jgi:hypothetical protein
VRVNAQDFWAHGVGHVRMVSTTTGERPFYWVKLDEARRDGPYQEAEIAEKYLRPLSPASRP